MLKFIRASFLWVLLLPYAFTYVGAASNQLVLIANNDKFPVMQNEADIARFHAINAEKIKILEAMEDEDDKPKARVMIAVIQAQDAAGLLDDRHCIATSKTHLNFLGDVFDLHDAIYSIGDFMLGIGDDITTMCIVLWVVLAAKKLQEQN